MLMARVTGPGLTVREAAQIAGVSRESVFAARRILRRGDVAAADEIAQGARSIYSASPRKPATAVVNVGAEQHVRLVQIRQRTSVSIREHVRRALAAYLAAFGDGQP
jgi:hypothetical protein